MTQKTEIFEVRIGTFNLKFHPYNCQIVQQFRENDYKLGLEICQKMIRNINNGDKFLSKL